MSILSRDLKTLNRHSLESYRAALHGDDATDFCEAITGIFDVYSAVDTRRQALRLLNQRARHSLEKGYYSDLATYMESAFLLLRRTQDLNGLKRFSQERLGELKEMLPIAIKKATEAEEFCVVPRLVGLAERSLYASDFKKSDLPALMVEATKTLDKKMSGLLKESPADPAPIDSMIVLLALLRSCSRVISPADVTLLGIRTANRAAEAGFPSRGQTALLMVDLQASHTPALTKTYGEAALNCERALSSTKLHSALVSSMQLAKAKIDKESPSVKI